MNVRYIVLVAITALVVVVAAACAPTQAAAPEPPSQSAGQPVAAVQQAPICQSGSTCQAPTAKQYSLDCVNKIPYTNVLVEPGTAFEVLDKSGAFSCSQSGYVAEGKSVVTCTGTQLYTFDLKLTNTACSGSALQTGTGQCQQGYGYDSAQQCCSPISGDDASSTVIQVNLGGCPLPRGAATPESTPLP